MRSKIVILLFTIAFFVNLLVDKPYVYTLTSDKAGYYLYLPAVFIHHDLAHLEFYKHVDAEYRPTGDWKWYSIYTDSTTGKRYNKYPAGVAVMEAPFFLAAYAYTSITHTPELYGYSTPYQVAISIANIFWVVLGLFYLRRLLLRYFDDRITAWTLFLIAVGTNLWYYSIYELGMSHTFSFGLFCMVVWFTEQWYANKNAWYAIVLGLLMGLITIVRPTNCILLIIILLWGNRNIPSAKTRLKFFAEQRMFIAAATMVSLAVLMVQLSYWHYTTGHWVIFSYKGEKFDLLHPHIIDGLTSYDKGWLVYTPIALFFLLGLLPLWRYQRQLSKAIILFIIVNTYIVFSWAFWQYGYGFGARALVESYALLAFPLAAFIKWLSDKRRILRTSITVVFLLLLILNVFQSWQLHKFILPGIWINKAEYWHDFGRIDAAQ